MRKPVSVVVLSLVILTVLAAPIKNIVFSQVDSRVLPASNPAAYAAQLITERFPGQEGNPIEIIIPTGANKIEQITKYTQEISKVSGVVRVGEPQILGNDVRVVAIHDMGPRTPAAEALIKPIPRLVLPKPCLGPLPG
jgi:RND superfamily putative drug exporter